MFLHANVEPLRWESAFFGLSSAKLCFDPAAAPLDFAQLAAFQRVQAKVPADAAATIDELAARGFRLVEGEIDCSCAVPAHGNLVAPPGGDAARVADPRDIPALRRLAASAFSLSRFREPWYRAADCRRFYAEWAEKAVHGSFDDLCLVFGPVSAPLGMVTLRGIGMEEARIGLLAVQPALAGRGIGRALFNAARGWCRDQHKIRLRVATQTGNLAALRLYISCGATIDGTAYWFYR